MLREEDEPYALRSTLSCKGAKKMWGGHCPPLSFFLAPFSGFLAAELPDDAALAEFAVEAGVGAGPASVQALLAVGNLHFLADDTGVPVRVMAAFIHKFHR